MLTKEEKKARFFQRQEKVEKQKKIILASGLMLIFLSIASFWLYNTFNPRTFKGGNYTIGRSVSYQGKKIEMTDIKATVKGGKFMIPLDTVIDKKIIATSYTDGKRKFYNDMDFLPITFFVASSGRIVGASAICEPCFGQRFYLQDEDLVCVACGTHWNLNDLRGIFGGCTKYPPEEFKYTVEGSNLVIEETVLKNWKSRYFSEME